MTWEGSLTNATWAQTQESPGHLRIGSLQTPVATPVLISRAPVVWRLKILRRKEGVEMMGAELGRKWPRTRGQLGLMGHASGFGQIQGPGSYEKESRGEHWEAGARPDCGRVRASCPAAGRAGGLDYSRQVAGSVSPPA